jgi:hypothetical protein
MTTSQPHSRLEKMLEGAQAEAFLEAQNVQYWCNRGADASSSGNDSKFKK